MTIHFSPGDANPPLAAHHQAQWRNHRIVAYGSGNNLILYTVTDGHPSLQTIYLEQDLSSVSINGQNGLLALSCGSDVVILRPVNEYMSIPKWTEALRFTPDSTRVNCVKWAPAENEIAAGLDGLLSLHHIEYEYGAMGHGLRWLKQQAGPVEDLDITADASKIVLFCRSSFDSFAKVWMRLAYGDSTSLFDLVYADHTASNHIVYVQWRNKREAAKIDHNNALAAMLHIKNIRSFMPSLSLDDNDVLYTVTDDFVLHVWATCDFNGHSYLKQWAQHDLRGHLDAEFMAFLLLDGACGKAVEEALEIEPVGGHSDSDYLLIVGHRVTRILRVSNVTANPPNSIGFEEVRCFDTNAACVPSFLLEDVRVGERELEVAAGHDEGHGLGQEEGHELGHDEGHEPMGHANLRNDSHSPTTRPDPLQRFLLGNFPIACTDTMVLPGHIPTIGFLVHDRVKSTFRCVSLCLNNSPELRLEEKFQGHGKSVRKMYTSSSSYEGNIMLSLLSFPDHNYIWEPLSIQQPGGDRAMAITKRFRLNVTRNGHEHLHEHLHEQGIENAVLLNDVYPAKNARRHHLAVVYEKGGFLSIWECDGSTMDDQDAALVIRHETMARLELWNQVPQAFFAKGLSLESYVIVAVYDPVRIEAWKIDVAPKTTGPNKPNISCIKISANGLPGDYSGFSRIAAVETFLEKDITVIDGSGLLRSVCLDFDPAENTVSWRETVLVQTNIENASLVHGASLVGKVAIVNQQGNTLSIWDSKTGVLEYEEVFPDERGPVRDLDWAFLGSIGSTANTLLAVGFARSVLLYTQLRYDYTNRVPTFTALKEINISDYSSHEIGDLIWLDDSYLVICSGNQFFIDDKWVSLLENSKTLGNSSVNLAIRQLLVGYDAERPKYPIADLVRVLNGPLPVYHPQFLIQAVLMDEGELVRAILVRLLACLRHDGAITWNLDLKITDLMAANARLVPEKQQALQSRTLENDDIFDSFSPSVADLLSEKLTSVSLPLLTRHQQTTLRNLVILMNKLAPLEKSLDANGLKYLYGFELFRASHKQPRLTIRDINWAVHSDQKEMLFAAIENHYHRLTWGSVKKVGLAYWVDEHRLRTTMEAAARNEFADERDPSGRVSVLYLAIKKKQILLGLWRTVSHPEKDKVIKFLSNNFSEPRWQSAALKNAFVLLGKHRYMDAAYFFLLAHKVKDCCMTLCNKVQEFDLALAVARANADQDALKTILEQYVLPEALVSGDRWTTSWVFWELKLKEISIQALVMSPMEVVTRNAQHFTESFMKEVGKLEVKTKSKSFLKVDPALGVLYQGLRSSKLRYLQGAQSVLPQVEFDFIVRLSAIYSKMGCDYLSLLLLRNWKFLDYSRKNDKKKEVSSTKSAFHEFSAVTKQQKLAPEPSTFEEPDMSAFSFGF